MTDSLESTVTWVDQVHFKASGGTGHEVLMDGPEAAGGQNRGSRPMELILMGLGGCTAYDIVDILTKGRQDLVSMRTELRGARAEDTPQTFTHITIHFVIAGRGIDAAKVQRAINMTAEKYCSASIMLARGGVTIEHSFELVEAVA